MIIKGLKTNYKTLGEGKPLLILHGWGSRSDNWQKVGETLAKNGIKVNILDLHGFEQSDKPQIAWDLDDYCNFVEEFVNVLNLDKFYLLGHSFGGEIAVKYNLRFPEKIDKLFLVSASCIRTRNLKKKLLYILSKVFKIFSFIPFLRKAFYRFIVGKSDYLSTEGVMRDTYLKIIAEDLSNILSQVQADTIIIWGEEDSITPISDARKINSKIKNSKLEILSGFDHDLNLKGPEELVEAIIKFL